MATSNVYTQSYTANKMSQKRLINETTGYLCTSLGLHIFNKKKKIM